VPEQSTQFAQARERSCNNEGFRSVDRLRRYARFSALQIGLALPIAALYVFATPQRRSGDQVNIHSFADLQKVTALAAKGAGPSSPPADTSVADRESDANDIQEEHKTVIHRVRDLLAGSGLILDRPRQLGGMLRGEPNGVSGWELYVQLPTFPTRLRIYSKHTRAIAIGDNSLEVAAISIGSTYLHDMSLGLRPKLEFNAEWGPLNQDRLAAAIGYWLSGVEPHLDSILRLR